MIVASDSRCDVPVMHSLTKADIVRSIGKSVEAKVFLSVMKNYPFGRHVPPSPFLTLISISRIKYYYFLKMKRQARNSGLPLFIRLSE